MSAPELKPCPFCGGEARYQIDHTTEERNSVWCGKCDFGMFDPDDTGSVVTAWNTRADLAPAAPKVKALVEAAKAVDGFMRGQNAYERSGYGPKLRAALAALEGGDA